MATKAELKASAAMANAAPSIEAVELLGEKSVASERAVYDACIMFADYANADGFDKETIEPQSVNWANAFAKGQIKRGKRISDGSKKTYASQMKLWAGTAVYIRRGEIELAVDNFMAKASDDEVNGKRFAGVANSVASRIRKAVKENKAVPEINPGLLAEICAGKPKPPAQPVDKQKAARDSFKLAALALQENGLADDSMMNGLRIVANILNLGTDWVYVAPEPAMPTPTLPATPADLNAIIAAAVAAAMAGLAK